MPCSSEHVLAVLNRSRCSAPANSITICFKMAERRIVFQCERTVPKILHSEQNGRTVLKYSFQAFQNSVKEHSTLF